MKKTVKMLSFLLVVVMVICSLACAAFAETIDTEFIEEDEHIEANSAPVYFDEFGNMYGATNWPSFWAAKNYYGINYSYFSCNVIYGGSHYNFYYLFDDGSRMYFGVTG